MKQNTFIQIQTQNTNTVQTQNTNTVIDVSLFIFVSICTVQIWKYIMTQ